jgi:hypothetical protein
MSPRQITFLMIVILFMIMRAAHFGGLDGWPF